MRLKFRKINETDLEKIMHWRMLEDVTKYMYTDPKLTIADQQQWFGRIKNDPSQKYWIINVDEKDVGLVNLYRIDPRNQRCEWAYYLASSSVRGKGIGKAVELNIQKYVFEVFALNKLCCEVFSWNEIVIKIHQKYGSKIEGIRKAHIFKNGEYHDIVEMAILREDWRDNIEGQFDFYNAEIE